MADKRFLVVFRPPKRGRQEVIASKAEIHGDHLALINSEGNLAALFLLDVVESWNEVEPPPYENGA
ncbi:MAG TPA: hypothetical protein VMB49_23095 [Acidobacteriaceae bacterium]|nr:hypothetical protein [Acidobacteriaceae bacterium]